MCGQHNLCGAKRCERGAKNRNSSTIEMELIMISVTSSNPTFFSRSYHIFMVAIIIAEMYASSSTHLILLPNRLLLLIDSKEMGFHWLHNISPSVRWKILREKMSTYRIKSSNVSTVYTRFVCDLLAAFADIELSLPRTPGRIVVTRIIPSTTALNVVVK